MTLIDFKSFVARKAAVLAAMPTLLDTTETRLAARLAKHLAPAGTVPCPPVGYRCHVAEAWLECFGLPAEHKSRALVTKGVRHSLQTLLTAYGQARLRVAVPSDVYPVYFELAAAAGCPVMGYSSFELAQSPAFDAVDIFVVADPFKPRGSALSEQELQRLLQWLRGSAHRRVVVDAVYQFDTRLSASTQALLASNQTLVLHSLSKAWASPLLAGIAYVPSQDVSVLTPYFRALQMDRDSLALAQGLLTNDRARPRHLVSVLLQHEAVLRAELGSRGLALPGRTTLGQYLFVVPQTWEQLVDELQVVSLPLSVFGSTREDACVVSSLPLRD